MASRRKKNRKTTRRTVRKNVRDNSRQTKRAKQQTRRRRRARTQKKPKRAKFFKSLYHSGVSKAKKFKDVIFRLRDEGTSAFEVQNDYSPPVYEFIKRNYEEEIISLKLCRQPIRKTIDAALNLMTIGKWNKEKSNFGYDDFYHLFLVGETSSGKQIKIEKNEIIVVETYHGASLDERDCVSVDMPDGPLKLGTMLKKTEDDMKEKDYFLYDAFTNNCQLFAMGVLSANGLMNEELRGFIYQDMPEILKTQPSYMKKLTRGITDTGGRIKRFLEGTTNRDKIKRNLRERGSISSAAMESIMV